MITAGVLLAAGRSTRFGADDKLLAPYRGRPLVTHAAEALRAFEPDILVAAVSSDSVAAELPGFRIARPGSGSPLQSDSLRAGIVLAKELGADQALVVLGDMPHVTPGLLREVAARCTAQSAASATDGRRNMPPACFPAALFPTILALRGDKGARSLLQAIPEHARVAADNDRLKDIDTQEDLAKAVARKGQN